MDRRRFLMGVSALPIGFVGCRGQQVGEVMKDEKKDLSGSHGAGAETFKPMIDESVGKLLGRHCAAITPVGGAGPAPKRIAFVGLENKSSEDIGDFKDQIIEVIDNKINESKVFHQISRSFVEAGLRTARVRPDDLFVPASRNQFVAVMETQGSPFDYLLFARLTSGTTRSNANTQKDYLLTLELVDIHAGTSDKESASIRKGYHKKHW